MKAKEKLNALKAEIETLNKKLAELTDEELAQVAGGTDEEIDRLKEEVDKRRRQVYRAAPTPELSQIFDPVSGEIIRRIIEKEQKDHSSPTDVLGLSDSSDYARIFDSPDGKDGWSKSR